MASPKEAVGVLLDRWDKLGELAVDLGLESLGIFLSIDDIYFRIL